MMFVVEAREHGSWRRITLEGWPGRRFQDWTDAPEGLLAHDYWCCDLFFERAVFA